MDCGIAAIVFKKSIGEEKDTRAYNAMNRLLQGVQHRGPIGCGVSTNDKDETGHYYKELGLVSQVFDSNPNTMEGDKAIGMTRYGTTGEASESTKRILNRKEKREKLLEEQQPFHHRDPNPWRDFSFVFNGQLTNHDKLREYFKQEHHYEFLTGTDTEPLMHLIAEELRKTTADNPNLVDVFSNVSQRAEGCYNIAFMDRHGRIAVFRDKNGFRPLSYAENEEIFAIASETIALRKVGFKNSEMQFVNAGELLVYNNKLKKFQLTTGERKCWCSFENIYFMNIGSQLPESSVYRIRKRMGEAMAQIEPLKDRKDFREFIVLAVPDTAKTATEAYARKLGLEFHQDAIIKMPFTTRAFLLMQEDRKQGLELKYEVIEEIVKGRKVVVVDDSKVRGDASKNQTAALKECGAKEVHFRVTFPPIQYPCRYGIDFPVQEKLLAFQISKGRMSVEELEQKVAKAIGCDSFKYPPKDIFLKVQAEEMKCSTKDFCLACVTGNYPV